MIRIAILLLATLVSSCALQGEAAGDPAASATIAVYDVPTPVGVVRDVIRREIQRRYGEECGIVSLPDRAIVSVEITGGGAPEYAVLLGRAVCSRDGNSGRWQGTGGAVVQFWLASGETPRMLLEHQMHGFTPVPTGLLSLQHGGYCTGGGGPGSCLVGYRWRERDGALEVTSRRLYDAQHFGRPPTMEWPYESISR